MRVILLGSPGIGKGVQATKICEQYKIPHIATGDIFRENIKKETELGKKAKEYMDRGELVPDEIVCGIIKERLQKEDCKDGFLLDGFPRTLPQAESLNKILKELNFNLSAIINLIAAEEIIINRLSGRRVCKNCGAIYHIKNMPPKIEGKCDKCSGELYIREDDKIEVIKERLKVYEKQTAPLIEYYKNLGILKTVNAGREAAEVFEEIGKILK